MYRVFFVAVIALVANSYVSGTQWACADEQLPAPLGRIGYDRKPLEYGGKLSVIEVKFDEVGEDAQSQGIQWTLRANEDIRLSQLHDALQSRAARLTFYKTVKGADIEVYETTLSLPNGLEFAFLSNKLLEKGMAIEVWVYLSDERARQLIEKGATKMTFKRR